MTETSATPKKVNSELILFPQSATATSSQTSSKELNIEEQEFYRQYKITNLMPDLIDLLSRLQPYSLKSTSSTIETLQMSPSMEEGNQMDWQEKYIEKVDQNISEIKQGLRDTENRISDMINKHIEYTTHLDEERHNEILKTNEKIDRSIESINNKIDQSIAAVDKKIDFATNKIDSTNKWVMGLVITSIAAIAAMVLSVLLK